MCIETQLLEEPKSLPLLFVHRQDIDLTTRIKIGVFVNYFAKRGLVTSLAKRYKVSRPFIYTQKRLVKGALSNLEDQANNRLEDKHLARQKNIKQALSYRIRGGLSLSKISDFLLENGFAHTSQGWISEQLNHLGSLLGNVISGWQGQQLNQLLVNSILHKVNIIVNVHNNSAIV